jgi:hypothetical protein
MDNAMTFWDRLSMYIDAIGVENSGTAWDLSSAALSDNEHRGLASLLIGGIQQ